MERVNDSIRNYIWEILGGQTKARSNVLKTGTGFDAVEQFLANLEDAIASPVDNAQVCVHAFRLRLRNRTLSDAERHDAPTG